MNALSTRHFKTLTKVLFFKCSRTFGCKANPPQPPFKKGGDNAGVGAVCDIETRKSEKLTPDRLPEKPPF